MIVPAGVLIPADQAGEVAAMLAESIRRRRYGSPAMYRVVDELGAVAAAVAEAGSVPLPRLAPSPDDGTMTVARYAQTAGLSERRVRQLCAGGALPAFKVAGAWHIDTTEEQP